MCHLPIWEQGETHFMHYVCKWEIEEFTVFSDHNWSLLRQ